jgi:Putative Ig domain
MVEQLSKAARVGRRTTRATLAIAGFSLLGVVIIAVFGLSGQGVPDLRSGVLASVTTLVAAIAGFYFGAQTASKGGSKAENEVAKAAPGLGMGPGPAGFIVGSKGTFTPVLTGRPPPTVNLTSGHLPAGLELDETTGVIAGTPAAGTAGEYDLTLAASNAILPPATLQVKLTVSERPITGS